MISGIGGGMRGMPTMNVDAMRQMQHKAFNKADADASGGLDAAEFESMTKSGPMSGKGSDGVSSADAFTKIDADANGQLSEAEMETAHQQMMERFQSTMQAFGQGSKTEGQQSDASWETLLRSIDNDTDEQKGTGRARSSTDNLLMQLQAMIEKVGSTYSAPVDSTSTLLASA